MPKVAFVHSLFRSGSTYFFEAMRRSSTNHICFQEAFHEIVLEHSETPTVLITYRNIAVELRYKHPPLSAPYFAELARAWPAWAGKLDESDICRNYFCNATEDCGQG